MTELQAEKIIVLLKMINQLLLIIAGSCFFIAAFGTFLAVMYIG